jgi:hypothetical protein
MTFATDTQQCSLKSQTKVQTFFLIEIPAAKRATFLNIALIFFSQIFVSEILISEKKFD